MDDRFSVEPDMHEKHGQEKFEEKVFGGSALLGKYYVSEKNLDKLNDYTKEYIDKALEDDRVKIPLRAQMQITIAIVNYAKKWDSNDENAFWDYICAQFGYKDVNGSCRQILCNCILNSLQQNHRLFLKISGDNRYKSTIMVHSLSTKKDLMGFCHFLEDFYVNNMNMEYSDEDPLIENLVNAINVKLGISSNDFESNIDVGSKIYNFKEGITKLIKYRPQYSRMIISQIIGRIDASCYGNPAPAKDYLDRVVDEWLDRKNEKNLSTVSIRKRSSRIASYDISKIRISYRYSSELGLCLCVPDIRMPEGRVKDPKITIFSENKVIHEEPLVYYGNELGWSIHGFLVELDECIKVINDYSFHLRAEISFDGHIVYDSESMLYRDALFFDSEDELRTSSLTVGQDYHILAPANESVNFKNIEILEEDNDSWCFSAQIRLLDGYIVSGISGIVASDEKTGVGRLRVILPKTLQGVTFRNEQEIYEIVSSGASIDLMCEDNTELYDYQLSINGHIIDRNPYDVKRSQEGVVARYDLIKADSDLLSIVFIDKNNSKTIFSKKYKVLDDCIIKFNKPCYLCPEDYLDASVEFSCREHENLTMSISNSQTIVSFPCDDGCLDADIPFVSIVDSNGRVWRSGEYLWKDSISDDYTITMDMPSGYHSRLFIGESEVEKTGKGSYLLGRYIHRYPFVKTFNMYPIKIKVFSELSGELGTFFVAILYLKEQFVTPPEIRFLNNKLWWDGGETYAGDKREQFNLAIKKRGDVRYLLPLRFDNRLIAELPDIESGRFAFDIYKSSDENMSLSLAHGSFEVGDDDIRRFNNRTIKLTTVSYNVYEKITTLGIQPAYIKDISYIGTTNDESIGMEYPVYEGIMGYMTPSGFKEFSSRNWTTERGKKIHAVNPVKIMYINNRSIQLFDSESEQLYCRRVYDRERVENTIFMTDDEPVLNTSNGRDYYHLTEFFSYTTE